MISYNVYRDGVLIGTATSTSATTWTLDNVAIDAESDTYTVAIADSVGNTLAGTGSLNIALDTVPPTTTSAIASYVDDVGAITNNTSTATATDDPLVTLTGTNAALQTGEVINVYRDGILIGAATSTSATAWTLANVAIDSESDNYTVAVADSVGNTFAGTGSLTIALDTVPPTTASVIVSYVDNAGIITSNASTATTTDDPSVTLQGTNEALQAGEVINVYRDGILIGAATSTSATTWTLANVAIDAESDAYTVAVADSVGNTFAGTGSLAIALDTTPPTATATISTYTDDIGTAAGNFGTGTTTDDRQPVLNGTITGTFGATDVVRIYDGSTYLGNAVVTGSTWTYPLSGLADDSSHTYNAKVTDAAGNTTNSNNFVINIDLAIIVNAQSTLDTTPVVTGQLGFALEAGEYLVVTINGVNYSSATGDVVLDYRNNTWSVQIPDGNVLTAGTTYEVAAVLRDAANVLVASDATSNELVIGSPPVTPPIPPTTDANNKATALTLGEDGLWRIFANMAMLDQSGTNVSNVGTFTTNVLYGNAGVMGVATFVDFDRDGDMDIAGQDSVFDDGNQAFENRGSGYTQIADSNNDIGTGNTNTGYFAFQIGDTSTSSDGLRAAYSGSDNTSAEAYSWYGGVAGYDKVGDGYVDFAYGDNTPNDENAGRGLNSSFILNDRLLGSDIYFHKDGELVWTNDAAAIAAYETLTGGTTETLQSTPDKTISTVDLNNDGAVDIVYIGGDTGSNYISGTPGVTSSNNSRLVVASNSGNGQLAVTQIIENALVETRNIGLYDAQSMTWADFNGDGYMDLFQGTAYGTTTANENRSRIYYNDGTGKLSQTSTDGDAIGEAVGGNTYYMNDTLRGGGSVAVDWNMDGKMDIVEIPFLQDTNAGGVAQQVLLFTNNSTTTANSFTQSTLTNVVTTAAAGSAITGVLTMDLDWDGDKDVMLFTGVSGTRLVNNTTTVADGTSLHLKIVDQNGINALFGNTVKLYDSNGVLVATQVLNPQSGNQTSDSSALISFYGLDPSQTYTAVMLRNIGGASQDVGGLASVGGFTVEQVNAGWTNLSTAKPYEAYVLTAEAGSAVNNANIGNGIIGTGYNDTFMATAGTDKFEGGGGSFFVSDARQWSDTGGEDIVDYLNAGSTAITANLNLTTAQNTGFGTHSFSNVEGLAGGSGADTFTDSAVDNLFEGRGGNDTFNLTNGGNDTLTYNVLAANGTGGNGADTVNGFWVGAYLATANADRIDVSELLIGYTEDADGPARYVNGVATLDAGETIGNYLSLQNFSGNSAQLFIDRDGAGAAYNSELLLTINFANATPTAEVLTEMLANQQFVL